MVLVSDNSDGIDGFVRVTLHSPAPFENGPETEIATLYVQPRHKGKGIGKRLLDEVFRLCVERQCDGVWLAVNSENQDAIAFYERLGFTREGQTTFRIGDQSYANAVMVTRF
ncbi:GNAT family N-acetyltransferase [Agrobacterium cavarae]|uniref:GNAT family N-acetyltransferase n=1 Tax=Agrobacterium cavarae TaxID=2528239 RepID=UPI001FE0BE13|nr:GNAT family N-acetyltransferase [Agrobacterium cavarae]